VEVLDQHEARYYCIYTGRYGAKQHTHYTASWYRQCGKKIQEHHCKTIAEKGLQLVSQKD
jgi:hypothetical protein